MENRRLQKLENSTCKTLALVITNESKAVDGTILCNQDTYGRREQKDSQIRNLLIYINISVIGGFKPNGASFIFISQINEGGGCQGQWYFQLLVAHKMAHQTLGKPAK